jgi:hypothetical protein
MSGSPMDQHGEKVGGGTGGKKFLSIGESAEQRASIEGILTGREDSLKYPGNYVYQFTLLGGEQVNVGGNTFLNDKLTEIGAIYRVTYTGVERSKRGRGFKTFEIVAISREVAEANNLYAAYGGAPVLASIVAPPPEPESGPLDNTDDDDLPF